MNSSTVLGDGMDQSFSAKVIRDVFSNIGAKLGLAWICLLYTSPSPRDLSTARLPSAA